MAYSEFEIEVTNFLQRTNYVKKFGSLKNEIQENGRLLLFINRSMQILI